MRYVHILTFQLSTKLVTYYIQSETRILPFSRFKKLADEQNITLSHAILINQSTFLNEENNQ